jgi:hypothetical protein
VAQAKFLIRSAVVCSALVALVNCDKPKEQPAAAKLGEPVGVRVGSLNGAFAVTQGQAPEPLVPGMARVLNQVGKNCPALFAKGSEPVHMRGKVSASTLSFTAAPDEPAEIRCFREAMHGQKVSDTPFDSEIGVELRPESPK